LELRCYLLLQIASRPDFDWQAWDNDSQALVAAPIVFLTKQKNLAFHQHETIQQNYPMELPRKRALKNNLKYAKTSRLKHFVSKS